MKIVIPGNPIAKMRHRTTRFGTTYDPQDREKKLVKLQMECAMKECFRSKNKEIVIDASNLTMVDVFELRIHFYLPIANSSTLSQRNAKLWGFDACNKKPDLSNLLKFYEDCANEVFYPDDSMIVKCEMFKQYSDNPRTEIEIMPKLKFNIDKDIESIINSFRPEELKEFIQDASRLSKIDCNDLTDNCARDKTLLLTEIAYLLAEFSNKYSENFKKICKYKNVLHDMKHFKENNKSFENAITRHGKTLC